MKLNRISIAITALVTMVAVAPIAAQAQEVNHRLHNQHRRIEQGIHSGELTRREAHRVVHNDRVIHAQERLDRLTDHGHLTGRERAKLNRELNRNSSRIYRLKHNNVTRP